VATPVELLKGKQFLFGVLEPLIYSSSVKLQLQMQRVAADREFKGPLDCIRQVVRARGPAALWTGFSGSLAFRANFFWMFLSIEVIVR
jgi:solute carrier family 25 carnitine/acylcarnitine transporter 20/29